jgi:hypothetical protein
LKPFIPNRAELLSAKARWGDEERGRLEDDERGRWREWENFYFSVLRSSFFLLPSSFFLLPSD